jgi:dienelactone hydrolase
VPAIVVSLLIACTTPAERRDVRAEQLGFERGQVEGKAFSHVVFRNRSDQEALLLHVYLGGDGSPARALRWIPPDPTPETPVALELMSLDPNPSVFLGRPCYHGAAGCSAAHWTVARYGEEVVASLAEAARNLGRSAGAEGLVLLGFSGGGTLSMLVAERLPEVQAVVTVAANLDVGAWVEHHDFEPFVASLDPAQRPALDPRVVQVHLAGEDDRVVPPALVRDAVADQPSARFEVLAGFDHACCWLDVWPGILAELSRELADRQKARRAPTVAW